MSVGSFGMEYQSMGWACMDEVVYLARRSRIGGFQIVVVYTFFLIKDDDLVHATAIFVTNPFYINLLNTIQSILLHFISFLKSPFDRQKSISIAIIMCFH